MSKNTMKAIRLHAFGSPDVLRYEDAPIPRLVAGEVLVRVHAIGLNPPDWYLRDGYRGASPRVAAEAVVSDHPGHGHVGYC